jgi:radical SAM protein with 4Fe4S-binding SPASM domain
MSSEAGLSLAGRIDHWKTGAKMLAMGVIAIYRRLTFQTPFASVAVETSTHCHRRCSYCPVAKDPKPKRFIEPSVLNRIVEDLAEMKFSGRFAYHHYNEPLLNRGLERLVATARTALPRATHVIYTSGDHLTADRHASLRAAGINEFVVTDHGPLHGAARDPAAEAEFRSRAGVRYRKMGEAAALFNRGGLIERMHPRTHRRCYYPAYEIVIDIEGNVIMCCNDYYGEAKFGNVMNSKLADIWSSAALVETRRNLARGRFESRLCRACVGLEPEMAMGRGAKGRKLPLAETAERVLK